jgi:hypothetical protein
VTDARLVEWCDNFYPPGMLRSRDIARIRQVGEQFVSPAALAALRLWMKQLRAHLAPPPPQLASAGGAAAAPAAAAAAGAESKVDVAAVATAAELSPAESKAAAKAAEIKKKLEAVLLDFDALVKDIEQAHSRAQSQSAGSASSAGADSKSQSA